MPRGVFVRTDVYRKKLSEAAQGRVFSEETRRKLSLRKIGNKHWLGRHHRPETIEKIRESNKLAKIGFRMSESHRLAILRGAKRKDNHYEWKGLNAGYRAKHSWIQKNFGKASRCENPNCLSDNPSRFEWANISKKYLREASDYIQLCKKCHTNWDHGKIIIPINS